MRKIFLISLIMISVLTISAAAAAENMTDTQEISEQTQDLEIEIEDALSDGDSQKKDLNITIDYPSELVKEKYTRYPYQVKLQNVPNDYWLDSFDVYVDDQFERTMDIYGDDKALDLTKFSYGNHTLLIKLNGTERYNPANFTHEFTLSQTIIHLNDEITVGYSGAVLHSDMSAMGYFEVYIDGKLFKKVELEEDYDLTYAGVSFKGVEFGTHEVEAIYTGGNGHERKSIKKTVNVTYYLEAYIERSYSAYDVSGNYMDCSIYGKEKTEVVIGLPNDVTNSPIVTIDGKSYSTVKEGRHEEEMYFRADLTFAPIGSNKVTITYPGDKKYPEKTITTTLDVIGKIEFPSYAYYNESKIILRLPEDAKGNLTAYVNGEHYKTVPMVNGEAGIVIDLAPKASYYYQITATYDGTDYDVENETENVKVYPKVTAHEMTYGEEQIAFIEINPDSEMNISYYKNNVLTPIHMVNGKGNFTITTDGYEYYTWEKIHQMDVIIVFDGDELEKSITINPLPSKLVANDITTYYSYPETYTLTVWGPMGKIVKDGEEVKITIDSKSSYKYTNRNGKITFKVDLAVGTHKITASYLDAKITTKVVVNQPLKLYAVTIKKSAKKLYLKATLKKGKTPMKNKQITFKFNGKKYTAKTNKKGVAKVTIKSTVLKKLKAGKKVIYQATYLKDTVKKTAKVKK